MSTKKFPCRIEEIPVFGEFVVSSAEKDINDLNGYSPLFTIEYLSSVKSRIEICKELIISSTVVRELNDVTQQLHDKGKTFRLTLNALNKYLQPGRDRLNIAIEDVGLKNIRVDIRKGNIEKFMSSIRILLVAVKRNLQVLEVRGMTPAFINEIETQLQEINSLNEKQNSLISKHDKVISENIDRFNDLWNSIRTILTAARVIYRDTDEVKMKDYTFAQLKRRVNAQKMQIL
jgi:hypothetical protein